MHRTFPHQKKLPIYLLKDISIIMKLTYRLPLVAVKLNIYS